MKKKSLTQELAIMGVLAALIVVMAYTPLGYLPVGLLVISFMMIPVALGAVSAGAKGGAFTGTVFGITSLLQCFGKDVFGTTLFDISPISTVIMCIVPRMLAGLLVALFFELLKKKINIYASYYITGFCAALFNTVLFMTTLLLLFGHTDYLQNMIDGRNIIVFICSFIGVNAVFELIAATVITGLIGTALKKAKLIGR